MVLRDQASIDKWKREEISRKYSNPDGAGAQGQANSAGENQAVVSSYKQADGTWRNITAAEQEAAKQRIKEAMKAPVTGVSYGGAQSQAYSDGENRNVVLRDQASIDKWKREELDRRYRALKSKRAREEEKRAQEDQQKHQGALNNLLRAVNRNSSNFTLERFAREAGVKGFLSPQELDRFKNMKVGGINVANPNNIWLSTVMLGHGIFPTNWGKDLPNNIRSIVTAKVSQDKGFRKVITHGIFESMHNRSNSFEIDTAEFYRDRDDNFRFEGRDLNNSIGKIDLVVNGERLTDGRWLISYKGQDDYDFEWRNALYPSNWLNDWAFIEQGIGVLQNYDVPIEGAFIWG